MITKIPDDPFSGIVIPPVSVESIPVRTDIDPGIQISRRDSASVNPIVLESQASSTTGGSVAPFTATITGLNLTLTTGTVNGLIPTNVGSTFVVSATGTQYLLLSVSTSNAKVASSSFSVSATPAAAIDVVQGQPPATFDICIYVIVNAVAFRTIGNGSLICTPYEAWRFAKAMTSPDSMPYDSYYSWRVSLV